MKNQRSLASMSNRKKKGIIIGCAIGGIVVIALSVGLGVGLTQCKSAVYKLEASGGILNPRNRSITFTASGAKASKITWSISETPTGPVEWNYENGSTTATLILPDSANPIEDQTLIVTAHINGHDESKTISIESMRLPSNLSLTATTSNHNSYNHGVETTDHEIQFNSYDNRLLTIDLQNDTNADNLTWLYSNDGTNYHTILDLTNETGLNVTINTLDEVCLSATNILPEKLTYSNFYVEATIPNSSLTPEPVHVFFHNAPEVKTTGGIITQVDKQITAFDTSKSLGNYDTIYIPADITKIASGIFSDKFTGSGNCQTIQNIIFADRGGNSCDVGEDAFSSSTDLVLTGEIYMVLANMNVQVLVPLPSSSQLIPFLLLLQLK